MSEIKNIPDIIFIIPYRNREKELAIFKNSIKFIQEKNKNSRIFFIHQCDERHFNRGAMKNIGYLVVKDLYPNNYADIVLVFNDVDIAPKANNCHNYYTDYNVVKHFYGYTHTLGGIVSIRAGDFEKINGFPNFWTWGFEDRIFQERIIYANMNIDRSDFYEIKKQESEITDSPYILTPGTSKRIVSRREYNLFKKRLNLGFNDICELEYNIDDNFVNVTNFITNNIEPTDLYSHNKGDLNALKLIVSKRRGRRMLLKYN